MYNTLRVILSVLFLMATFGIYGQSPIYNKTTTDNRKLDSIINESWYEQDARWNITDKYNYFYSVNGSTDSILRYTRDQESGNWTYMTKWVHIYDQFLRDTLTTELWWDTELTQWYIWNKIQKSYNTNDSLIQYVYSGWGNTPYQIVPLYKINLEFENEFRSRSTVYVFDLNTSQWTNSHSEVYEYNNMGDLTLQNSFIWDVYLNQWNPSTTEKTSFDASGKKINYIRKEWNINEEDWTDELKINYSYNENKKPVVETYYEWNQIKQLWIPYTKITYDYEGNTVVKKLYNAKLWNGIFPPFIGAHAWEIFSIDEYTYNEYEELIIHVSHGWTGDEFVWNIFKKSYFYSTHQSTPVNNWSAEKITIYPNPASNFIFISVPENLGAIEFEVFNLKGSKVLHQTITETCQININGLVQGLYLYRLGNKDSFKIGKIIIK